MNKELIFDNNHQARRAAVSNLAPSMAILVRPIQAVVTLASVVRTAIAWMHNNGFGWSLFSLFSLFWFHSFFHPDNPVVIRRLTLARCPIGYRDLR